ncbi:unnamed protein product [Camellia sinensis]
MLISMANPVIDFSKLNGEERAKTMAQIANACEEWGFFQIPTKNHPSLVLAYQTIDMKHFYVYENGSRTLKRCEPCGSHGGFTKETMTEYRSELRKLGEKVMEAMDENLGLPKGYIKKAFNGGDGEKAFFGTKVSHYPPCPHPDKVIGLRAHTDAGGVILLYQDDKVGGLQILKDGQWIDVQPMPNSIVINTGDQIEVLSNGRYKSVWHRVLTKLDGNRRSIASFYNPSLDATIAPAKELVMEKVNHEEDEEVAYPKYVFGDYMSVYAEQKFLPKEPRFLAVKAV